MKQEYTFKHHNYLCEKTKNKIIDNNKKLNYTELQSYIYVEGVTASIPRIIVRSLETFPAMIT